MGKKGKTGKQRKDRFYQLAKETGYRSRASFKLIQLNRKFEFLQKSRVAIDLCAAPGGWLQVCRKFMPVSSVVIGVDLVAIKPIPNVITLTKDITTDACRTSLKKELKTWKADLVLNDGAPNVGKSWIHDAFIQNRLTLSALKLASEFLAPNGTFVTKIFRSKDYNALLWVMSKIFKKVSATKPQASRNESAEIFVVCQHFVAPDKIDPKFFDPSFLFQDIENDDNEIRRRKNLLLPATKQKRTKAEGYKEGTETQFTKINASEFLKSPNHIENLASANEIVMDTDEIKNHELTSEEIKECCRDIKILGRKDILLLIKWRKKLREQLYGKEKEAKVEELDDEDEKEEEEDEFDAEKDEEKKMKKKKKKMLNEKRKLLERIQLKMVIKNDQLVEEGDEEIFNLKKLKNKLIVKDFEEFSMSEDDGDDEDKNVEIPKFVTYDKDAPIEDAMEEEDDGKEEEEEDDEEVPDVDDEDDEDNFEENDEDDNELLDDLGTSLTREQKKNMFFKKAVFEEFMNDEDEDIDNEEDEFEVSKDLSSKIAEEEDDDESESDDEDDDKKRKKKKKFSKCQQDVKLDATGFAIAEKMVSSSKIKRDMIDDSWNRFARGEEDVPVWFREDEKKYNSRNLDLDPQVIAKYQNQLKELNVRPIKKVAEAKARKKKRTLRRLDRLKKKSEEIHDAPDMSEREKSSNLRTLYKKAAKATKKKDKEVKYVVAKKGQTRKRPAGVKGRYKMVDGRMKKDSMKKKKMEKSKVGSKKPKANKMKTNKRK